MSIVGDFPDLGSWILANAETRSWRRDDSCFSRETLWVCWSVVSVSRRSMADFMLLMCFVRIEFCSSSSVLDLRSSRRSVSLTRWRKRGLCIER